VFKVTMMILSGGLYWKETYFCNQYCLNVYICIQWKIRK